MRAISAIHTNLRAFWGSGNWVDSNHARTLSPSSWSPQTNINYAELVGDIGQNSAVQAVLNRITMAWGESYPCVKRAQGDKKVIADDHPLADILHHPNTAYDDTVLWAGTIASFWGDGNAYWGINRNATGALEELVYIPHQCLTPKRFEGSRNPGPDYYEFYDRGKSRKISPLDIVHFRFGIDPWNDMLGMSPWKSVAREVYTDNEALNYINSGLKNGGATWMVASPKHPDAYFDNPAAVKAKIEAQTTGDSRHRVLVMDGATEFTFPPSMKDTGPDALRRTPETRIAALAGFPAIWCGFQAGLERSTYSNTEQAEKDAWRTMVAVQRIMGRQLTMQTIGRPGNFETRYHNKKFYAGFDYSEVRALQPDKALEWDRVGKAYSVYRVITIDEARAEIGYDALTEDQRLELMPPEPEPTEPGTSAPKNQRAYAELCEKIAIESSAREQEFKRIFGDNANEDDLVTAGNGNE